MSNTGNDNAMHSGHRPSHRVRWGVAGTIGLVGALGVSAFMVLPSVSASPSDKVNVCHATSSTTNPYTVNTISTSSVDETGNKYLNGHGDHTGPVYTPAGGAGWGDIIPPFTDAKSGMSFPGQNWTSAGEAVWNAGCNYASPSPTATPTETSASPTPTSSSPTPTPTQTTSSPTPTPTETTVSPTPTPITTSPAPITTSPAPTSSPSPTPITTPSVDGTPTPPAPVATDSPNPSGGLPTSVAAGGGPGELPGKPTWLWLVAAAFLALLIASMRQLLPGRERS